MMGKQHSRRNIAKPATTPNTKARLSDVALRLARYRLKEDPKQALKSGSQNEVVGPQKKRKRQRYDGCATRRLRHLLVLG
jgi:hypothetical protein